MKQQTRTIRTERDKDSLIRFLSNSDTYPMMVTLAPGEEKRSVRQNKLGRLWCKEAGEQGDMTAEQYRGYCKLHFGVPIMRRDNDEFCEKYDRLIRHLPYEHKLELMQVPMDFPVTRIMGTSQKHEYLDAMWRHFTSLGFQLTDPAMLGIDSIRP